MSFYLSCLSFVERLLQLIPSHVFNKTYKQGHLVTYQVWETRVSFVQRELEAKKHQSPGSSETHPERVCGMNAVIPRLSGTEQSSDPGHCWLTG